MQAVVTVVVTEEEKHATHAAKGETWAIAIGGTPRSKHTHTHTQAHTHLHDAHEDDFLGLKVCADEAGLRDGKRNAIDTLRSAGRVRG